MLQRWVLETLLRWREEADLRYFAASRIQDAWLVHAHRARDEAMRTGAAAIQGWWRARRKATVSAAHARLARFAASWACRRRATAAASKLVQRRQSGAAQSVQQVWRKQRRRRKELVKAVVTVQRIFRGSHARRLIVKLRRQVMATIEMQRQFRAALARRTVARRRRAQFRDTTEANVAKVG